MTHYLHRDNTALYSLLVKTDTKLLLYFKSKSCVTICKGHLCFPLKLLFYCRRTFHAFTTYSGTARLAEREVLIVNAQGWFLTNFIIQLSKYQIGIIIYGSSSDMCTVINLNQLCKTVLLHSLVQTQILLTHPLPCWLMIMAKCIMFFLPIQWNRHGKCQASSIFSVWYKELSHRAQPQTQGWGGRRLNLIIENRIFHINFRCWFLG